MRNDPKAQRGLRRCMHCHTITPVAQCTNICASPGSWIQVKLSRGVRAHWPLLKQRLKKTCNMDGAVLPLWSTRPATEDFGPPFLLSVSSYDQQGFLHGDSNLVLPMA